MIKENKDPYSHFDKDKLILRDWLAVDRTVLANERTFLAYIRTSLAVFIVVVGLFYYFKEGIMVTLGYLLIPFGAILFFYGLFRYFKTQNSLEQLIEGKKKHM